MSKYVKDRGELFRILYDKLEQVKRSDNKVVLSIVIPLYNEEETIKNVLERMPKHKLVEVIVIDDHSTDNSFNIVNEIKHAKVGNNIRLIRHKKNLGYGKALLTGIKKARGKIIVTMDSDGQHRPEDIFNLVEPILNQKTDIAIGSRYQGTYNYRLPLSTRLGESFVEKVIFILFGQRIMNNQSGFRAFNHKTLSIFDGIKFEGYAFTTEILLKAALKNYRIKECPIHLLGREYGSSKIILNTLTQRILLCFIYYTLRKINNPYYKKWMIKRILFLNKVPPISKQKRDNLIHYRRETWILVA
ncbi:MAG: glycosyltransferase family 2 protein [Candidatus Hodarchaeota archaeon]